MAGITDIPRQRYTHADQRKKLVSELIEKGFITEYQVQFFKKDQTVIWCSLNAKIYRKHNGDIDYIEGFLTDITERKQYEESLKKSNAELEHRVIQRTKELSNWVSELEQRNTQSILLRELSETVQVCKDYKETYQVISKYLVKFFPKDSGQLFVYNQKEDHLESVAAWGSLEAGHQKNTINPELPSNT